MTLEEALAKIRKEVAHERGSSSHFAEAWAAGASYVLTRVRELTKHEPTK